eukprot:g32110.t1
MVRLQPKMSSSTSTADRLSRTDRYCASYAAVANWNPQDFGYVVHEGSVHTIAEVRADRAVRLGNPVNVDRTALQAEDLGARGTYYKHHKAAKIGAGGIHIWPGLEVLCENA